jgi:Lrp/AsnC family leucine-responsive transcriptional regulator
MLQKDEFDGFDLNLLDCLQDNSRQTAEALAAQVGLSPAACQRRVKKLRDSGAISKEVAILDPSRVAGRTTLIVQICFSTGRTDTIDTFKVQMASLPEVQQGYYCVGEADFVLIMTVADMREYDQFTRRYFFGNPAIRRFEAIVTIDTIKTGFKVPLSPEN